MTAKEYKIIIGAVLHQEMVDVGLPVFPLTFVAIFFNSSNSTHN